MSTVNVTVSVSSAAAAGLRDEAARLGLSVEALAQRVLEARFAGLSWQASKVLEALLKGGALPGRRVSEQSLFSLWVKVAGGAPTSDLSLGVDALYGAKLIDGAMPDGIVLTQEGYDRMTAQFG